jgi:tetratricopeptide (TPR) repeat protein
MIYFIVSGIAALLFLFVYIFLAVFKKPKKLNRIWEAVQAGETRDSIRELKSIMMKQGGSVDTHFLLAECYRREGNCQMAVVEYRYCLNTRKKPTLATDTVIRNGLVECYFKLDKEDDALAELLELVKGDPGNADYLLKIAKLFYNRGNLEQAVTYFDRTLRADPASAESLSYLGMIMFQAHQYKEALVYLNRVLKFEPKDSRAHYYLGRLYRESKDWQKALYHFETAQISPEYRMRTFIQKGYCHKEMNEPESAVEEFKKGILSAKGRDMNLLLLARYAIAATYETAGKLADAIEQWEEINKVNPRYRDVLQKLDQYKDLRGDDNLKDFLVSPAPHFEELCRRIMKHLGLEILELKLAKTSLATAIAIPREADKRTIMRQRVYCKINRDAVNFGIAEVKQVIEEAKTLRCTRAIYVSPMSFGKDAIEFSSGRQITLIGGKELSHLLGEMDEIKEAP